jgi:MoaA/NifB/PqqE/SkfB family radical SAM enzyme
MPWPRPDLGYLGRYVDGDDNVVFGTWNRVVAWMPGREEVRMLPGHGGEIVPGRFEDHIERLRANLRDGRERPVQLDLDLSMACPSACTFCFSAPYRNERSSGRLMDRAAVRRVIEEFAALGVRVVRFDGGGDPLAHPGLLDAIRHCHRLGLTTAVLTAGDLLHERQFETFVEARTYVRVSLNAASDATRLALHRPGARRLTVRPVYQHISRLDGFRRRHLGSDPRAEMLLGATSMIHPGNVDETYDIAAAARDAGCDHLSFRVVLGDRHAVGFSPSERAVFEHQQARVRTELVDDRFQVFFPTRSLTDEGYVPARYFSRCRASTHRALVEVGPAPDRPAIVPCGRYRGEGYLSDHRPAPVVFGTLRPDDSVGSTWMGPAMRATLDRFPRECGDCIDRSANVMLEGITDVLATDADAAFYRFALDDQAADDVVTERAGHPPAGPDPGRSATSSRSTSPTTTSFNGCPSQGRLS